MQKQFEQFVHQKELIRESDKILLAFSGGVDSVVLGYLLHHSPFHFAIAHVNFQLRGDASTQDAHFAKAIAENYSIPYFTTTFDTNAIAERQKESIQLVARQLRYEWLKQIRIQEGYSYIATAHHLNDSIETFLYNFTKGTGLRGLQGVPLKNEVIIRPLLFADKAAILAFAEKNKLSYREDSSNASDKYARNKIRHHVVPILKTLNPALEQTSQKNFSILQEALKLYEFALVAIKKEIRLETKTQITIDRKKLLTFPAPATILYECIKDLGFNASQSQQILENQKGEAGAIFNAPNYRLLVDRDFIIVEEMSESLAEASYTIEKGQQDVVMGQAQLKIEWDITTKSSFSSDPNIAQLDQGRLSFPLKLRHWQAGDYFCPLGMKGKRQKIQDFFSNQKISRFDKEKIWLLETANGEICWILGYRIDDRFKLTPATKQYILLNFGEV